VTPGDLGRADEPAQPLGSVSASERMSDEYLTGLAQLLQAMDKLCEPFFQGVPVADAVTTAEAQSLKAALRRVLEKPLLPYYAAIGNQFFEWLGFPAGPDVTSPHSELTAAHEDDGSRC